MRKKYELFVNNYDKIACNVAAAARFFFFKQSYANWKSSGVNQFSANIESLFFCGATFLVEQGK